MERLYREYGDEIEFVIVRLTLLWTLALAAAAAQSQPAADDPCDTESTDTGDPDRLYLESSRHRLDPDLHQRRSTDSNSRRGDVRAGIPPDPVRRT